MYRGEDPGGGGGAGPRDVLIGVLGTQGTGVGACSSESFGNSYSSGVTSGTGMYSGVEKTPCTFQGFALFSRALSKRFRCIWVEAVELFEHCEAEDVEEEEQREFIVRAVERWLAGAPDIRWATLSETERF